MLDRDAGAAARGAHPGLSAWSCTGGDGGTRRHRRPGDTYSEDPQPSMSYLQAILIALVQGVTELFPVSSLGHSVLVPAWIGGSWETLVTQSSQADSASSFYLAFIVALHCATALALLWFFRIAGSGSLAGSSAASHAACASALSSCATLTNASPGSSSSRRFPSESPGWR